MLLTTMPGYIKSRPKGHPFSKSDPNGPHTRQHSGFVLAKFPRDYPITAQQRKVRDMADSCGIHTGITRKELIDKMVNCVGPNMRKR